MLPYTNRTSKRETMKHKLHRSRSKTENLEKGGFQQEPHVLTMPSSIQHQHLRIQTSVLKVNLNCHGCRRKVHKVLRKIEGVYSVSIDSEQHRVIVKGIVDSSTLIKKLIKSGKHAELWSQKSNHKDNKLNATEDFMDMDIKEMENLLKGISGNSYSGERNYPNDISSMMQMMGINEHPNNQQGYHYGGGPVKNSNYQQFQNYPAGLTAYGYQNPSNGMMGNLMNNQYNQNLYAEWLRANNPQNMMGVMNNRMLDGYLNM